MILIDVDGVLADFCAGVERTTGPLDWSVDPPEMPTLRRILCAAPGWCLSLPEIPGAVAAVRGAVRSGLRVAFVTSPLPHGRTWAGERAQWLRDRGLGDVPLVHTSAKWLVRGVALVDDSPEHVRAWSAAHPGHPAILVNHPANRSARWADRVDHVAQALARF